MSNTEERIAALLRHGTICKTTYGGYPEVNVLMNDNDMANELFDILEGLQTGLDRKVININEALAPKETADD